MLSDVQSEAPDEARKSQRHAEGEPVSQRLALLARASEELGASLDVEATARGLVALLVPALADHAIVDLVDVDASGGVTNQLRRAAMAHSHDAPPPTVPYTVPGEGVPYAEDNAAMRSLRSGRPVLVEEVDEADLMAGALDPQIAASLAAVGVRSQVAVPLFARDGVIGVLLLKQSTSGRRFTDDDVAVAAELAARAGVAIDNARRYAREHDHRPDVAAQPDAGAADADPGTTSRRALRARVGRREGRR